jgi:hypothetical protein
MLTIFLTSMIVIGLAALVASLLWMSRVLSYNTDALERPDSALTDREPYDDAWVHQAVKDLTLAVNEGIEHASRSERRVRAVVASAKRRFEAEGYADPGLEAEAAQLPLIDESGGREEELQAVQSSMEPDPFAGIPGTVRFD